MRSWMRRFAPGAFAILLCAQFAAAANLKSAVRAYNKAEESRKSGDNAAALKDYGVALKELTPLAKEGNPEAEALLGQMYLTGHGVLKDPGQANRLFKASAEQGNADAQFYLGAPSVLHHQNVTEGMEWLKLSAEQGNQDAQLLLGETYMQGISGAVTPDPVQADMWLRLAARNNLPFYQTQLLAAERQMAPNVIARGKALADAWQPKHGLRPATVASEPHTKPAH